MHKWHIHTWEIHTEMRMRVDHLQYIIKMDEPHKYYSVNEAIPKSTYFMIPFSKNTKAGKAN